jgi:hypothetical protein
LEGYLSSQPLPRREGWVSGFWGGRGIFCQEELNGTDMVIVTRGGNYEYLKSVYLCS